MSESPDKLARRWFEEIWNQRRIETIYDLMAPDAVGHLEGEDIVGPDPFVKHFSDLMKSFPDLRLNVEEVVVQGEAAAVRWSIGATHRGSGLGLEPTGRTISIRGMTLMHVHDGKIVEAWDSWDRTGLLHALR
jgi:steroid delta-isomerase-like uncharacterized protein